MENTLGDFVAGLRHTAQMRALGGLSDRKLLGRFVETNDGTAFAALVERHGPMVLGVCRRALSRHDAEDACQAVFLVLARKAAALSQKESLGCWLHGVARRVAANARRDARLRTAREAGAAVPVPKNPAEEASWHEVWQALDEELERLPERYRAPLVLCYLECLTRDEAAGRLGISAGTLHGRLERGRNLLRDRLTRRGLSLPAVLTAVGLADAGTIPPTLAVSTANAATLFATGQPVAEAIGSNVVALTREILMSMTMTRLKCCAAAVLFAALTAWSILPAGTAQDPRPKPAPTKDEPGPATTRAESDETFIRRVSKDLRESDPTPAEVHFFLATREPGKRQKLVDLFIEERKARKEATSKQARDRMTEKQSLTTFALQHASAHEVVKSLEGFVAKRGAAMVVDPRTNSLLIRAGEAEMGPIKKMIEALDDLARAR